MTLQRFVMAILLSLLVVTASANPYAGYPGAAQMQQSPTEVLKQGIEQLTSFLANRDGRDSPPLEVFVEQTIAPFFDFAYMARSITGPRARYMGPQEVAAMQQKFRRLFLSAMIEKLTSYRHGHVQFLPPAGNPRTGEIALRLLAYQQGNRYPQRLSFRMYRSNQGWKVYDVSANGQSALGFFRTQFELEARRQQPRPDYPPYARPR